LFWHKGDELHAAPFDIENAKVLELSVKRLSLSHEGGGSYLLSLEFERSLSLHDVESFLRQLIDAFTVSMAASQRDPWYGNLLLDAVWSSLQDCTPVPAEAFSPLVSSAMTSEEFVPISKDVLQALEWHPLTTIFADGMRSPQPKSKFLYWFVILEELENRAEFRRLFRPLFSDEEKTGLLRTPLTSS
jgi:hypothetical protein